MVNSGTLEIVDEALIMSVEESPILYDRTSDGTAKDLVVDGKLLASQLVGEEVGGVEAGVPKVIPAVTMVVIGPALG